MPNSRLVQVVAVACGALLIFAASTRAPAINAGRAQIYREAAAKNGVTPEAAGASAFVNAVQPRLKPGQFYRPAGGGWIRK